MTNPVKLSTPADLRKSFVIALAPFDKMARNSQCFKINFINIREKKIRNNTMKNATVVLQRVLIYVYRSDKKI